MKVFERDSKINFVDDNNVLVGFDYEHNCCEQFGYLFSKTIDTNIDAVNMDAANIDAKSVEFDHDGWNFDKTFAEVVSFGSEWNEGAAVAFRLTKDKDEIFLILYNIHNGYYSHGFDMLEDGKVVHNGSL